MLGVSYHQILRRVSYMILLQHKKLSNFRSVFWQSQVSKKHNHIYNLIYPDEFYDQNHYGCYYYKQHFHNNFHELLTGALI